MNRRFALVGMTLTVMLLWAAGGGTRGMLVGQSLAPLPSVESQQGLVDQYCAYLPQRLTAIGRILLG